MNEGASVTVEEEERGYSAITLAGTHTPDDRSVAPNKVRIPS